MMKTLSHFMSSNERRMSRLLTPDTEKLVYIRDLYVQGFIHEDNLDKVHFYDIPYKMIWQQFNLANQSFLSDWWILY